MFRKNVKHFIETVFKKTISEARVFDDRFEKKHSQINNFRQEMILESKKRRILRNK
jgi:hypothetical protein